MNKVSGRTLLQLTEEKLFRHPYNLSGGGASAIIELIKALEEPLGKFLVVNLQYLMLMGFRFLCCRFELNDSIDQPIKIQCIFKYGKDSRNIAFKVQKSEITLSFFLKKAKSLFMFP